MNEEEKLILETRLVTLESEVKKDKAVIAYLQGLVAGLEKKLTDIANAIDR